jgi:hypothetical protein
MPGLSLRSGVSASYAPMSPAAANTMTAGGVVGGPQSISQMAYGINGAGATRVENMPAYGAVGAGLAAVGFLVFLWWSLPR